MDHKGLVIAAGTSSLHPLSLLVDELIGAWYGLSFAVYDASNIWLVRNPATMVAWINGSSSSSSHPFILEYQSAYQPLILLQILPCFPRW